MNDVVRFPANVPYPMWPELYGVFAALDAGDAAEAQRRWNASTPTPAGTYCQRAAGAIQDGYLAFADVPTIAVGAWDPDDSGYQLIGVDDSHRFVGYVDVPLPPYQQASPIFRVSLSDSSGGKQSQLQLSTSEPPAFTIRPGQPGSPTPAQSLEVSAVAGSRVYYAMCCGESGSLTVKLRVDVPTRAAP